jgi:hypothetical protein
MRIILRHIHAALFPEKQEMHPQLDDLFTKPVTEFFQKLFQPSSSLAFLREEGEPKVDGARRVLGKSNKTNAAKIGSGALQTKRRN